MARSIAEVARRSEDAVRSTTVAVQRDEVRGEIGRRVPDRLATEEPMEIRLHGPGEAPRPVAVTLRTPGHDFELAVGFLLAEGLLRSRDDVVTVGYCMGPDNQQEYNVVTVRRTIPVGDALVPRPFTATSACGLCGKATIDELEQHCADLRGIGPCVDVAMLSALPAAMRVDQSLFAATGGVHAAALATPSGNIECVREDVGRHNALDKLLGRALLDGHLPLHDGVVVVSGRLGFELVQKAAIAGVTVIAAVGAPSSLAVSTARRLGVTTVAFLRDGSCSVYTHQERVAMGGAPRR
jgi:FdhD protein